MILQIRELPAQLTPTILRQRTTEVLTSVSMTTVMTLSLEKLSTLGACYQKIVQSLSDEVMRLEYLLIARSFRIEPRQPTEPQSSQNPHFPYSSQALKVSMISTARNACTFRS
nr:hypothetical protein CFP56_03934 [Quercus suber]